jgi:predicted CopG family antitoxin
MSSKYKNIVISKDNYRILKELGNAGDSFNDVLTELLGFFPGDMKPRKEND